MLLEYCLSDFEMVLVAANVFYHFCFYIPPKAEFILEGLHILESFRLLS
jgi:hypothetical protein